MTCETCRHFRDGLTCARYPQHVSVPSSGHSCGEWSEVPPSDLVRSTEIMLLQTSDHSRRVCSRLGLTTVQDLLDVGRSAIVTHGKLDRAAINQISVALSKLGITW